jgi:hypothetical protein
LIAGTVSYLHMHLPIDLHAHRGGVAALTPFSVDLMIVAASTTLLANSRTGGPGGILPWALLAVGEWPAWPPTSPCRADGHWPGDCGVAIVRAERRL